MWVIVGSGLVFGGLYVARDDKVYSSQSNSRICFYCPPDTPPPPPHTHSSHGSDLLSLYWRKPLCGKRFSRFFTYLYKSTLRLGNKGPFFLANYSNYLEMSLLPQFPYYCELGFIINIRNARFKFWRCWRWRFASFVTLRPLPCPPGLHDPQYEGIMYFQSSATLYGLQRVTNPE